MLDVIEKIIEEYADILSKDQKPTALLTSEQIHARSRSILNQDINAVLSVFKQVAVTIEKHGSSVLTPEQKTAIDENLIEIFSHIANQESPESFLQNIMANLGSFHHIAPLLTISSNTGKSIHQIGQHLVEQKLYLEAAHIFSLLTILYAGEENFWIMLGLIYYQLEKYEDALTTFDCVNFISFENEAAHFHAARCFLKLNQKNEAFHRAEIALENSLGKDIEPLIKKFLSDLQ